MKTGDPEGLKEALRRLKEPDERKQKTTSDKIEDYNWIVDVGAALLFIAFIAAIWLLVSRTFDSCGRILR